MIPAEHRVASPDLSDSFHKPSIEENPFHLRDDHLNDVSRTPKNLQGSKMSNQVGSSVLRTNAVVGLVSRFFTDCATLMETNEKCSDAVQEAERTLQPSLPRASFSTQMSSTSSLSTAFTFTAPPPSSSELLRTIEVYGLSRRVYRNPYYSRRADAPEHPREYAGLLYHLKGGDGLDTLEEWKSHESQLHGGRNEHRTYMSWGWEYAALPPSKIQVKKWLKENPVRLITKTKMHSQVSGKLLLCQAVILRKNSGRGQYSNESLWREINAISPN
jgi:DNA polymerase zeta